MDDQEQGNSTDNQPGISDISPPVSPQPQPELNQEPSRPAQPNIPQVISNNQKPKKRWPKVLAVLIVLALAGAAAWYFVLKDKTDTNQTTAQTSENKDIGLLKIGIEDADYGSLYPDMSTSEYSYLVNAQMFEGLVRYEDKSKIVPDLATDWTNPDSKTWVFTIKKGVKFHDGNTLSPEDVKYSLDKIIDGDSELAQTFGSTISAVDTVGSDKVKITTTEPDTTLLNKLTFLYVIDADLPKGDEPSQAGTGPYEIKTDTKPTTKSVEMVAYDDYHLGKPTTRALSFGNEDDADKLLAAFADGKYDIVGSISLDKAAQVSGATRFVSTEPDTNFIALNTIKKGPLQNPKVREAIRYSIDPVAIGKARGNQTTPLSQMVPDSIPGYNPTITLYKRDVDKAKKLLKDAGYPNGITLHLSTADTSGSAEEIAKELKEAGITLKLDRHDDFDEFIGYFTGDKVEMYTVDYASDTLDGLDIYQTAIGTNIYKSSKFKKLLDDAANTTDPEKRLKLLQAAAVVVDEDIPVVPISTEDDLWLMNKDYGIVQDMPSSFISVYFYKTQLK